MSTLTVVEEILRTSGAPISVREIVERAGARLPSKSKTPDTVVARDLAMDIKRQGDQSRFVRTSPGRYTLRAAGLPPLHPAFFLHCRAGFDVVGPARARRQGASPLHPRRGLPPLHPARDAAVCRPLVVMPPLCRLPASFHSTNGTRKQRH